MKFADRVCAMFAPNVIWHKDKKLGLLRSIVGGRPDHANDNGRRGRINTLLVGDPGTAKSILAREATRISPNSRFVTAQNASGKSLVAIVDKENDSTLLRLGVAVLVKNAICAINEISCLSFDDQQHLIDIAEEGRCTVDKYAFHFDIDAPTTIIATANPYNATWNKSFHITKDEIPTLRTFLDRCDQVFGFRDAPSDEEIVEYTKQKSYLRRRKPHNYNFLKKYLMHAKNSKPTMSPESEEMLNEFWIRARTEGMATNRTYDSLFRLAEAQAKFNLKMQVDDEIATQTMESVRLLIAQYGKIIDTISSPKDVTYIAFFNILKNTRVGLSVTQLCKVTCEENKQISQYLGDKWDMAHNRKVKPIIDMLLNYHPKIIIIVNNKPIVLQYIADGSAISDTSDIYDNIKGRNQTVSVEPVEPVGSNGQQNQDIYDYDSRGGRTEIFGEPSQAKESEAQLNKSISQTQASKATSKPSNSNDGQASKPGDELSGEDKVKTIYRLGHSDNWACNILLIKEVTDGLCKSISAEVPNQINFML